MIGKTRQESADGIEERFDPEVGPARGILRREWPEGQVRHQRMAPSPQSAYWIAHYWMVQWDLRGCAPQTVENLPHPNVHLIFENGESLVSGVHTRKFSRILAGKAQVCGIKFRPGGFQPFCGCPVSDLADRVVPASSLPGMNLRQFETVAFSSEDLTEISEAADIWLQAQALTPDPIVACAAELVDRILAEPEIKTVADLSRQSGIGLRRLQRIFREYVGASPKWVIRRYRLHELIERMNVGRTNPERVDWAQLAQELGYFDQAHLIKDFKAAVGRAPAQEGRIRKNGRL